MAGPGAQNGYAALHVGRVHGASTVLASRSRTPVRMLTPKPRGQSVWACTSSLGGGLVAGDTVEIDLAIDPGAVCFLGTQSSTKIYRNPHGRPCAHELKASVGDGATLVLAPDPVQCFAGAAYEQRQIFHLDAGANLVVVDWISAGRLARGERWAFRRYASRNEIFLGGRPLVIDAVELEAASGPLTNRFRAGRFDCLATLILAGPALEAHGAASVQRVEALPVQPGAPLLVSASPLKPGAILRFAGGSVEAVGRVLAGHLAFVKGLLEDDPWSRKW